MAPHVERMVEEGEQLANRFEKLHNFMNTALFLSIPEGKQRLMSAQYGAMKAYIEILTARVALEVEDAA